MLIRRHQIFQRVTESSVKTTLDPDDLVEITNPTVAYAVNVAEQQTKKKTT